MTRKEMYSKIKNMHLEDEIAKVFGKNFTNVSNVELSEMILYTERNNNNTPCCKKHNKNTSNDVDFKSVIIRIVSTLQGNELIDQNDAEFILRGL